MKPSFTSTVGIIARVLSWRYSRVEARRKAESYLLDLAKPDKSQIQVIAKNFSINVKDNAVYVKTRSYVDPERIVISNTYRLLDKESSIVRMIVHDHHIHGIGFLTHFNSILRKGFISVNLKKLIKKYQSKCVTCRKIRLLPSSSEQSPQNVLIYANGPPFASCKIDFAGEFYLKDNLKT